MTAKARWRHLILLLAGLVCGCAHFQARPLSAGRTLSTYEQRSLGAPGLRAFLAANHEAVPRGDHRWSLKALALVALYYQPSLAEARAQLLAAQAAEITAGERPNPSISMMPGYDHGVPNVPSPWIVPVSLDWPIETAGRRGDRINEARDLAVVARWKLVGTVWQVRSRVRSALLDLYAGQRREMLLSREASVLERVVHLLVGQFRAGIVSSYQVTQARVSLDKTVLEQQTASGQARQARVRLASALGVPLEALNGEKLSFADFRAFPRRLTRPLIRHRALLDRADVRAALAQYAASQSALQLQIARQWPDIDLGPGYSWNSQLAGDSEWQLGLALKLPILNHNQGPIAQARAQRRLAAAHFLAVQAAAIGKIDGALVQYRSALARVSTARVLLAEQKRQLATIRAQVEVGELQPLDLVDAQLTYDTGKQNRLNAQVDAQVALGRLQSAVQSPLSLPPSAVRAAQTAVPENAP